MAERRPFRRSLVAPANELAAPRERREQGLRTSRAPVLFAFVGIAGFAGGLVASVDVDRDAASGQRIPACRG